MPHPGDRTWGQQGKASGPEPRALPGTSIYPGTHSLPQGLPTLYSSPAWDGVFFAFLPGPSYLTGLVLCREDREVPAVLEYAPVIRALARSR